MTDSNQKVIKNKLLAKDHFIGIVEDLEDPQKKLRARVRVYGLMDEISIDDLPWATYWLPPGCRYNEGEFRPCKVGDTVWIDFPHLSHGEKDTRRPRITGSVHWWPEAKQEYPEVPHEAFMYGDKAYKDEKPKTMGTPSEYGKSHIETHNGISVEFVHDGTWRIWQRATGTAIEITPDGGVKISSDKGISVHAKENISISSESRVFVSGDDGVRIKGIISESW